MGILDRLTGTRRPQAGVPAVPVGQLYDAIVALNRADVPWVIRSGASEGSDLVAEWISTTEEYKFHYMIVLRLDEARREVVTLDRLWQSDGLDASYGQGGNVSRVGSSGTIERDANGKLRIVRSDSFDTRELKNPIREVVTASGWTWRPRAARM